MTEHHFSAIFVILSWCVEFIRSAEKLRLYPYIKLCASPFGEFV